MQGPSYLIKHFTVNNQIYPRNTRHMLNLIYGFVISKETQWCCVGGRDEKKNLVLSNELIKVELSPWKVLKAFKFNLIFNFHLIQFKFNLNSI